MEYILLSADREVARFDGDKNMTVCSEELLPAYFRRSRNLEGWLASRAIDSHRPNSRVLKRALRLRERDDIHSVLAVHAVTVTDTYWVKTPDSSLTWEDVRFTKDIFSRLALRGGYDNFQEAAQSDSQMTQELTNIGSFEKCWKRKDGSWWLYKQANKYELFSEYFIYLLGRELDFKMAEYYPGPEKDYITSKVRYIMSRDFTDGARMNYEPLDHVMGDYVEDYSQTYHTLEKFGKQLASDYVSIIFMDAICANPDRHSFNLGILRDAKTGKVLSLAPNFDNNMALISRGYPAVRAKPDLLIEDFNALLQEGIYWEGYSERRALPPLSEEMIVDIIHRTKMKVRSKDIAKFIMSRFHMIGWP